MPNDNTQLIITPEADQVERAVRTWLQQYPEKPIAKVDYDFTGEATWLTMETIQAAYKTAPGYICGGYPAQYQFAILYQSIPTTTNERLEMDEVLGKYAAWAEATAAEYLPQYLPQKCRFRRLNRNTNAALLGRDANGSEIHQIMFTLLYEVNV